jgi:hypothetical protein
MESHLLSISHAIQLAVAPVFLLTGVGAFLNFLSVRLARIIDRHRLVQRRVEEVSESTALGLGDTSRSENYYKRLIEEDRAEMRILQTRLTLVYRSIALSVVSALFVCLVVATGFVGALTQSDTGRLIAGFFIASMGALVLSLYYLLQEIRVAVSKGKFNHRP